MNKHCLILVTAFALLFAGPALSQATSGLQSVYAERFALVLANTRCRLLSPGAALSAEAGQLQARGSLLRAGLPDRALYGLEASVRTRVAGIACSAPGILSTMAGARSAHAAWLQLGDVNIPIYQRMWRVRRIATDSWRADQFIGDANRSVRVGLVEVSNGYAMAVSASNPVLSARLIVRDPARSGRAPLVGGRPQPPPRAVTQIFLPASKGPEPFSPYSKPLPKPGTLFMFQPAAREALMRLDPREAFEVELVFAGPNGLETTRHYSAEVGDFGAAFMLLSAR